MGRILSPRREEEPEIVRSATPDEIKSRKIITPVSRKRSDRATSSTGIGTPSTTSTDTGRECAKIGAFGGLTFSYAWKCMT
jgi:hypothetical protein